MDSKEITFVEVSRETYESICFDSIIGYDSIDKKAWFVPTKLNENETKELLNKKHLNDTPKCFSDISYKQAYLRYIDSRQNRRVDKKRYIMAGFVNHNDDGSEQFFLSKDILNTLNIMKN